MKRARGFTLLEVLLAVSVAIILTATMAGTITIAFRLKKEAEFAVDSVHDIQIAGDVFVEEVGCAVPPNPNSSADPNAITTSSSTTATTGTVSGGVSDGIPLFTFGAFYGDSQILRFYNTGTDPKATLPGDIKYIEFELSPQEDGALALVKRVNTNLLGMDAVDTKTALVEEVLITHVNTLTFIYFDETGAQTDTWDSTQTQTINSLPFAVEMILTLPGFKESEPERQIIRYAPVACAIPVPPEPDTTTTDTTGQAGL